MINLLVNIFNIIISNIYDIIKRLVYVYQEKIYFLDNVSGLI